MSTARDKSRIYDMWNAVSRARPATPSRQDEPHGRDLPPAAELPQPGSRGASFQNTEDTE